MQTKNTKQGGFTLVEIAIVLVIIGLLLGGILKGQELINNAKVRSVADRQNSLKAAWFGFIDRYNFIAGDSRRAVQLVPGAIARNTADLLNTAGDGRLSLGESPLVMLELTGAGFLRCPQCSSATGIEVPTAENSLVNQYSGIMSIWNESDQYSYLADDDITSAFGRLQIHSGPRIPSNILSEVDRKIDDGIANTGDMVFNWFDPRDANDPLAIGIGGSPSIGSPPSDQCMSIIDLSNSTSAPGPDNALRHSSELHWRSANAEGGAVENNCGASIFI